MFEHLQSWDRMPGGNDNDAKVLNVGIPPYNKLIEGEVLSLLPKHREDFDLVHSWHLIEHLPDPFSVELPAMLELLRPGGALLAHVPCGGVDEDNPDHLWIFTPEALIHTWKRLGLKEIQLVIDEYEHGPGRFNMVATIIGVKLENPRNVPWPL
ncbi:MAG: methyltransferase domain-containing protein [Candidatus Tritonobacter lacicola]|nr:methyltransferase domain-containing protein [Candidatus Tritonobacter lacicola]